MISLDAHRLRLAQLAFGHPGLPARPGTAAGDRSVVSEAESAVALAAQPLAPSGEARLLRRMRRVVRQRIRVELAGLADGSVSDGELGLRIEIVSPRDPYVLAWSADRLVALVVLHDGCGARVIGGGGLMGRVELPSVSCAGAFLAFCYDAEAGAAAA